MVKTCAWCFSASFERIVSIGFYGCRLIGNHSLLISIMSRPYNLSSATQLIAMIRSFIRSTLMLCLASSSAATCLEITFASSHVIFYSFILISEGVNRTVLTKKAVSQMTTERSGLPCFLCLKPPSAPALLSDPQTWSESVEDKMLCTTTETQMAASFAWAIAHCSLTG